MIKRTLVAATLLLPFSLWAADCNDMNVTLENGYARTVPDDPMALVAYIKIVNRDIHSHTITGIDSPGSSNVNFYGHGGDVDGATFNMAPLESIYLHPNGGMYEFFPGRSHVLLQGYRDLPDQFTPIPLEFTFADGCVLSTKDVYREN